MKTFSIKAAFKRGWTLFKAHATILALATLFVMVVSGSQDSSTHHRGFGDSFYGFLLGIALFAIGVIVQVGWIKMLLITEDGGKPELRELVSHADRFWRYLAVYILYGLLVAAGFLLFIIPGIYFIVTYQYATVIAVDRKEVKIFDTFRESARITKGAKWKLLGFISAAVLLNILGALILFVGLLVTIPVTILASIHIYRTLSKEAAPEDVQTVA